MTAGYSGTPLARKLSLKDGLRTWWEGMPDSVRAEIEGEGLALTHLSAAVGPIDAAHVFVTSRAALEDAVHRLLPLLAPTGFLWISWPKRAAKIPTDITEDAIRDIALPTGLVDVKVCAVDKTWSGLKLMIRRQYR
ncbi:MAG TPA: hypothetical protein VEW71_08085 [Allosphingosinicella sp.]|nr:hypothetical protein [Allosphingosinicella sp.]